MCLMKSESSSGDRISDLPEFIKHQILSYLPNEDSCKTSVLSKGWNSTWKLFPILDFRQENRWVGFANEPLMRELLRRIDMSLLRFAQRDLKIQKLFIELFWLRDDSVPLVDAWIPSALRSGVSELFFRVGFQYHIPEDAFSASNCSFSCFRLEKLSIHDAFMSGKIIQDIIRNCPNISDVALQFIDGVNSLEISGLHKLESLVFTPTSCESILVDVWSLKSFTYDERTPEPCPAIDLTACRDLKYLRLRNCSISDDTFHLNISRFRLLETLFLLYCDKLEIVKLSLQRLKVLVVRGCAAIKSFHIDAPTLSDFKLSINEFPIFSYNVLVPCNMIDVDLYVPGGTLMDSSWFVDLRRSLQTLHPGRISLQIFCSFNETVVSFDPNMIGEAECSSLVSVDHLVIPKSRRTLESSSDLIDGLLWSCRPKLLSLPTEASIFLAKIFCTKLLQIREGWLCCSGINFKCWRHYLKAARIDFIGNFSPYEKKGGIEYGQFRFALNQNSDVWEYQNEVRFSLEWEYNTTTTLTTENNPEGEILALQTSSLYI